MKRTHLPALAACLLITLNACSDDDGDNRQKQADAAAQDAAPADLSPDTPAAPDAAPTCAKGSFFALSAKMGAKDRSMCNYKGKVLLVVNIAAKCGFTPQLGGLAKLQSKFGGKGFEVLGFYCNQFLNQGGTDKEQDACETQYGVNFDTFDTLKVNPPGEHAIFTWLKAQPNGGGKVGWNFEKWLLGKDGKVVKRWGTNITPGSAEIEAAITTALSK